MKCTSCGKNLDGEAYVLVDGKPFCSTEERLAKLDADKLLHKRVDADGKSTINNFVSTRTRT